LAPATLVSGWVELPIYDCRLPIDPKGKAILLFNQSAISNRQFGPALVAANGRAMIPMSLV
jgi:hypothetical protein